MTSTTVRVRPFGRSRGKRNYPSLRQSVSACAKHKFSPVWFLCTLLQAKRDLYFVEGTREKLIDRVRFVSLFDEGYCFWHLQLFQCIDEKGIDFRVVHCKQF